MSHSKSSIENVHALSGDKVGAIREASLPLKAKESLKGKVFRRGANVPPLVAIGASAGGPKALATILSQLPEDFGAAVAIAQHIHAQFAPGLANWLDQQTPLTVELAKFGASPQVGKVLIAGKNDHLVLGSNLKFSYSQYPQDDPNRPSVNALFTSIANHWPAPAVSASAAMPVRAIAMPFGLIAVLLTGMGSDGAVGLKHLRSAGWHTIAQDRQTCAVFGMPKAAVALGAAVEVLPLSAIAPALVKLVSSNQPKFRSLFGTNISTG